MVCVLKMNGDTSFKFHVPVLFECIVKKEFKLKLHSSNISFKLGVYSNQKDEFLQFYEDEESVDFASWSFTRW
jgi:hypothetical protein